MEDSLLKASDLLGVFAKACVLADLSGDALESLRTECLVWALNQTAGHIWQHQGFRLHQGTPPWRKRQDATAPACLWGSTAFGDDVEDEWLTCWILFQLTRQGLIHGSAAPRPVRNRWQLMDARVCRMRPVTAAVWDNDGSFLLIEAANTLPKWLKPEVAGRRVWVHQGRLHIIPLPSQAQPAIPVQLSVPAALQLVRDPSLETEAGPPLPAHELLVL